MKSVEESKSKLLITTSEMQLKLDVSIMSDVAEKNCCFSYNAILKEINSNCSTNRYEGLDL